MFSPPYFYVFIYFSILKGEGIVKAINPFDAAADAKKLHEILTSTSSDKTKEFVNLVTKRSCEQRVEIKNSFDKQFGVSLCIICTTFAL